jgi:hypothetical protein
MSAIAVLLSLLAATPAAAPIDSVYSDISGEGCEQVEFDEDIGKSHMRCPGTAGFKLDLHDFDARMTLDVLTPDGKVHPLDFWQVITSGFSATGDKAEWRVKSGKPIALIVRLNASENPEDSTRITSWLVVVKITGEKICAVAKIPPSAKANQEARDAADAAASQPCLAPPA